MSEPRKYKYMPEELPERPEIRDIDPKKIVDYLLSALADELLAFYHYRIAASALKGNLSEEIAEVFKKTAEDELEDHFEKLVNRLQDFDVDLPDFRDIWSLSRCRYPDLPEDPYDIDAWLKTGLEAEKCALEAYREIYDYVKDKDPVTEEMIEEIISDEAEHFTLFRDLLSKK